MKAFWTLLVILATTTFHLTPTCAENPEPRSRTVTAVLREPLPPEDLSYSADGGKVVITGPTFEYTVDKTTGAVVALQVKRDGQSVVSLIKPASLVIGDYDIASKENLGETTTAADSAEKIILKTKGTLKSASPTDPDLPYTLVSTFFNDGVVVSEMTLLPPKDLVVEDIRHEVVATGAFRHYLHKTRDSHGFDSPWGSLPKPGEPVKFSSLTSCLQVFSPKAALAIFTDRGATDVAAGLDTAVVTVKATPGVEPTNNAMEQRFRFVVIDRKITQGTRGQTGLQLRELRKRAEPHVAQPPSASLDSRSNSQRYNSSGQGQRDGSLPVS